MNRFLHLLVLGLLLGVCSCQKKELVTQYWINKNIDWKSPHTGDPELDSIVEASTVNAVIFHSNGQFRLLSGNGGLGKDSINLYVEIYKIYSGTWEVKTNHIIELNYKVSCSFFKQKSRTKNSAEFTTVLINPKNNEFNMEGLNYIPANNLSMETKKRLVHYAHLPIDNLKNSCY